jgi:hypothetical protein
MKSLVAKIFMTLAYAIKPIVLIDFIDVCQDSTWYSILDAENTSIKPCILSNLQESPPMRRTGRCAPACGLRNQEFSGAVFLAPERLFHRSGEMFDKTSVATGVHDQIEQISRFRSFKAPVYCG